MLVLIVTAVYPPEPLVSARTSHDLASALAERGHRVRVHAPYPSRPAGKRYPGFPWKLFWRQVSAEGVEILRCASLPSPKSTLDSRFNENLTFGLVAAWQVLFQRPRPDLIYSNTWPLIASGLLALVSRAFRIPVVTSVQDIYPESLAVQNRLRPDRWLFHLLWMIDRWIARGSRAVVVISDRFAGQYARDRGIEPGRVHVIPNWADDSIWDDAQASNAGWLREKHAIPQGAFLLVYAGNIGAAAGGEGLLEAFQLLQDLTQVHLLIAGEGSHLMRCKQMVVDRSIERVHFHHPWLSEETASLLRTADALVLPTQGAQSRASLPSKLLDYLYSGRPMIVSACPDTELAHIVQQARCGWVIDPDRPDLLAVSIRNMVNTPQQVLRQMGNAGREYGMHNFSKAVCLPRLVEIIELVNTV